MKKKNKLLLIGLVTIGIGAGTYCSFAGGNFKAAMAYKPYTIIEKIIENTKKFSGEVISTSMETISFNSSKDKYELLVKKGDEVKKGQVLLKYNDLSMKLEEDEADMQKKLAEKEVESLQKQMDVAEQKLQKDKNVGVEKAMFQEAEREIQEQEAQFEMEEFEFEKTNQMIQANKEKASEQVVTSPIDGVIEEIKMDEKTGESGITIRIAGPLNVKDISFSIQEGGFVKIMRHLVLGKNITN